VNAREPAKNVVLTAANDSVGRVIAEAFLAAGDRVHICGRTESKLRDTLAANSGMRGTVADVGSSADVDRMFREVFQWMEHVDVMVNIAHDSGPRAYIEEIGDAEWQHAFDVMVNGAFWCIKHVVPSMKRRRSGCIINFSTASTRTAVPMRSPYVAAKSAIEGLTRSLARELGPFNIRCNAILPGAINNARLASYMQRNAAGRGVSVAEFESRFFNYVSLRRKIEMSEFAHLVLFLASECAAGISGQLIELGGNVEWEEG
jgi:NAD(P)-dependent dehydrogenase (short-subunit alcohol dehydrogenase family)